MARRHRPAPQLKPSNTSDLVGEYAHADAAQTEHAI